MSCTISKSAADLILREVIQNPEETLKLTTEQLREMLIVACDIAIDQAAKRPRPIEVANSSIATALYAVAWRVSKSLRATMGLLEEVPDGVDASEWEGVTGSIHNAADALELASHNFDDHYATFYRHQLEEARNDV